MLTFAYVGRPNSYGYAGRKVGEALARLDAGAEVVDLQPRIGMRERWDWDGGPFEFEGPVVALTFPEWLPHYRAPWLAIYTMYEARGLPAERVRLVNEHCQMCLVPSAWCAEGFREAGVTVPIEVVPLGVDVGEFPFVKRVARGGQLGIATASTRGGASSPTAPRNDNGGRPYRFLWNGLHDRRKAWDLVYGAFWEAFKGSDSVELVLHFRREDEQAPEVGDRNVRRVVGYVEHDALLGMMHEADCYVFPSRGEGWGLAPREAAATGLPAIVTDYSGLAVDIEHWALPLRVCKEKRVRLLGAAGERFSMAEPCPRDLADMMVWCFEHQEEARAFGRRASEWLAEHGTWERTARGIVDVVGARN